MNPNLVVGTVSLALGIAYTAQTLRLPKATIGSPWAPLLFPLGLGALMTLFGAILTVSSLVRDKKILTAKKKPPNREFIKLAAGTVASAILYAFLFDRIGFIASTLLFMGSIMFMVNGRQAWRKNALVAAMFTFGTWYVFVGLLKVNLP